VEVTSKDGTSISYERVGSGPAVILVGGGVSDRSENAPLADALAEQFTVCNYDRRGRGASSDTLPYAVRREIEDIEALIAQAGGSASVYGASSGGALALEAAAAGLAIDTVAVFEVPYNMAEDWPQRWSRYSKELDALLAEGRRGDAFELFMRMAGSTDEEVEGARGSPMWTDLEAIAPTLAYDAACLGDGQPPADRLARVTQPTLVITGGERPAGAAKWVGALDQAADAIVASIPHAERRILQGQTHEVEAEAIAPALAEFFDR
jgi:pimeloyl-ACP methyl ester carboxylesterase